jgi:hypothetical protein
MGAGTLPSAFLTLLDSVLVLGGHGDTVTGNQVKTGTPDDGGGIGMLPIVAVIVLGIGAVVLLMWLNRQEREEDGDLAISASGAAGLRLRTVAPLGLIAAVVATPLIVWTASSGGDEKSLLVDRWTNDKGSPELLISLTEDDANTLRATNGKRSVRVECTGRDGEPVLRARQKWPFILEKGYEYPHAHQPASAEQVRRAENCRVLGASSDLAAGVKGSLKG